MPVKRRVAKKRAQLSADAEAWLRGEEMFGEERFDFEYFMHPHELESFWREHSEQVIAEWAVEFPGTRPKNWWIYDAPREALGKYPGRYFDGKFAEPRLRVSGVGVTSADHYPAVSPSFEFGIPTYWHEIDRSDPPTFEAEATYLERLGLLLPGERRRLRKEDFEPESICGGDEEESDEA